MSADQWIADLHLTVLAAPDQGGPGERARARRARLIQINHIDTSLGCATVVRASRTLVKRFHSKWRQVQPRCALAILRTGGLCSIERFGEDSAGRIPHQYRGTLQLDTSHIAR